MGCITNLASIAKECNGGNAPGMKTTLYLVEKDDVASIAAAVAHEVDTITMEATKVFFEIAISKGDQQLITAPEGENENVTYNTTLQVFIPASSSAKSNILNDFPAGEFIVIAEDKKGRLRIYGDVSEGMTIRPQEQITDKNGYLLTGSWESNNLPYFFTGAVPLV